MELALLVYAIEVFTSLPHLFVGFIIVACIAIFILSMLTSIEWTRYSYDSEELQKEKTDKRKKSWKAIKVLIVLIIISALLVTLIPSKKTMYVMVGAYAAQKVSEDPDVKRLSGKVLQIIEGKMNEYITEAEKEVSTKMKGEK